MREHLPVPVSRTLILGVDRAAQTCASELTLGSI